MKSFFALAVSFFFFTINIFAQTGIIRGKVIDQEAGETLIGVAVEVIGLGTGTITDFDGDFELSVEPGNYSLNFTYLGYADVKVTNIEVASGQVKYWIIFS
jgi:hypothetical protein